MEEVFGWLTTRYRRTKTDREEVRISQILFGGDTMDEMTLSISNTLSKAEQEEEMSMLQASLADEASRSVGGDLQDQISNERIKKGTQILETYEVMSDAISGGMGSVWRVHHNGWNADLAMKRPQPRFFAEGSGRRKQAFIAECEHWINLGLHLNIVACYYVREVGGVPTIFSEWMDGGSLKDVIRSGKLYQGSEKDVQERILDIAIQSARGLAFSHKMGLIHQDVKPGNILLTQNWDTKVADFGLAMAQSQLRDNSPSGTESTAEPSQPGQTVPLPAPTGYTKEYCPAEQAAGEAPEKWMDVYAWALTVLEMYAGKRMWKTGAEAFELWKETLPGSQENVEHSSSCGELVFSEESGSETGFAECRVIPPRKLSDILLSCGLEKKRSKSFEEIEPALTALYQEMTGRAYGRPRLDAALDTAAALNNRALSFLDLGQKQIAKELLERAQTASGSYTVSQFNLNLLRYRLGESDRAGYNILTLVERGDIRNAWREICEADLDAGNRRVNEESEFGFYYRQLMEKLSMEPDPMIREYTAEGLRSAVEGAAGKKRGLHHVRYDSTAGVLSGGKVLLGLSVPSHWRGTGLPPTEMKLLLVDLKTGEPVLDFRPPKPYEFEGRTEPFLKVGRVAMSKSGKYAFAINMNMQPNLTGRMFSDQMERERFLKKQDNYNPYPWNRAAGVHVWDGKTGAYLKYLPGSGMREYQAAGLEGLWCSMEDEEIVTAGTLEWNVQTGACRPVAKRKNQKTEYVLPGGYTAVTCDYRYYSEVKISLDGKEISKYGGTQISVDPEHGLILDSPYEVSHSRYRSSNTLDYCVTLLTVGRLRFSAPMVLDKIRTSDEYIEEYRKAEEAKENARLAEKYLAQGNIREAVLAHKKVWGYYLGHSFSKERAELGWKFAHLAIPKSFLLTSAEKTYGVYRKCVGVKKDRDVEVEGRRFRLIPEDAEAAGRKPVGWRGHFDLQKASVSEENPQMIRLPEGDVETAFVVGGEIYCVTSHPVERDTIWKDSIERRVIACDCILYRGSLESGEFEKIGSGIKGRGEITFCGNFRMYPGEYSVNAPRVFEGDRMPDPVNKRRKQDQLIVISDDARIVIYGGPSSRGFEYWEMYLTDCAWEDPAGRPMPDFLTVDNGFESAKKELEEGGIRVFESGERAEDYLKRNSNVRPQSIGGNKPSGKTETESKRMESSKEKKGFFARLLGR